MATSRRLKFSHYLDNQLFTNGVNHQFSNWPSQKIIPKDESSNENKNDFFLCILKIGLIGIISKCRDPVVWI